MAEPLNYQHRETPRPRRSSPWLDVVPSTLIGLIFGLALWMLAQGAGDIGRVATAVIASPFGFGEERSMQIGVVLLWSVLGGLAGGSSWGITQCRLAFVVGMALHYLTAVATLIYRSGDTLTAPTSLNYRFAAVLALGYVLGQLWLWWKAAPPTDLRRPAYGNP